jgi:hypothetical protein
MSQRVQRGDVRVGAQEVARRVTGPHARIGLGQAVYSKS